MADIISVPYLLDLHLFLQYYYIIYLLFIVLLHYLFKKRRVP